ncbi:hypothetical protein ACP4OV_021926 [Aristida adscensionis]
MAGEDFTDFFSQPDELSPTEGFDLYSQHHTAPAGDGSGRAARAGLESLDLNSDAEELPHFGSYSQLLQPVHEAEYSPGLGRYTLSAATPAGRGQSATSPDFRPPRPLASGRRDCGRGGLGSSSGPKKVAAGRGRGRGSASTQPMPAEAPATAVPPTASGPANYTRSCTAAAAAASSKRKGKQPATQSPPMGPPSTPTGDNFGLDDSEGFPDDSDPFKYAAATSSCKVDRANWNEYHNGVLCNLCIEQLELGNYTDNAMSSRGYKQIIEKFHEKTGLRHNRVQIKNQIGKLKREYEAWKWLNTLSGIGHGPHGEVYVADDAWWQDRVKEKSAAAAFKNRLPPYFQQLVTLFHGRCVDGTTSYVPGQESQQHVDEVPDEEDEDIPEEPDFSHRTPSSINRKRSNSTSTTASSPSKKSKVPIGQYVKGLHDLSNKMEEEAKVLKKVLDPDSVRAEIDLCQQLAVECGAAPGTPEFFVAAVVFMDYRQRQWFIRMDNKQARFDYLRRWAKLKNVAD